MLVDPPTPRPATLADVELLARIGAEGFYDDPVFAWVLPDPATRLDKIAFVFARLAADTVDDEHSAAWVVGDACTAWWRAPAYDHHPPEPEPGDAEADRDEPDGESEARRPESPLDDGDRERFQILGETMREHHPREPHWYLNVVSTRPANQGRGLGSAVLRPVLSRCDADGTRAYLESTNPRNRTLYRRSGFVDGDEIELPDGPTILAMWRDPMA